MFHRSMITLGFLATSGLLFGCLSEDELNDDPELAEVDDGTDAVDDPRVPFAAGDPYVASTTTGKDQDGVLRIAIPSGTRSGDLLLLFLHRTDDLNFWDGRAQLAGRMTPDDVDDWNVSGVECSFDNSAGDFDCSGSRKLDLNQVLYWKKATAADVGGKVTTINFPDVQKPSDPDYDPKPAWAIMARVPNGGSSSNPVRAWKGQTSCDNLRGTKFPSVSGAKVGDLLLLSQSFDDGYRKPSGSRDNWIESTNFTAPSGFSRNAYVIDKDESGFLYSKTLTSTSATGTPASIGPETDGDVETCKDIGVSIIIRKTGT